ncbi:MAG: hypothetical protein EOP84_20550 [Verrucomicrobiaceae bacterium]|nr:MAG: hypothetical protein EOP84_20550 [Verrucomicrobiaceae bacterium]
MIGRADEGGVLVHIFDRQGHFTGKVSAGDGVIGWTADRVTIRRGDHLISYDAAGLVRTITYAPVADRSSSHLF